MKHSFISVPRIIAFHIPLDRQLSSLSRNSTEFIIWVGFYLALVWFAALVGLFTTPASSTMSSCNPSACSASCNRAKKKAKEAPPPTSTGPQPSFYQRKLPDTCVAFASSEGKNIFKSALEHSGLKSFYNLIEQHHTQTEPAFCGVSTRMCKESNTILWNVAIAGLQFFVWHPILNLRFRR